MLSINEVILLLSVAQFSVQLDESISQIKAFFSGWLAVIDSLGYTKL